MKGDSAKRPRWRSSLGIIVVVISTIALLLVYWQLSQLDREAVLSPESMNRERTAVAMSVHVVDAMQATIAFQQALTFNDRPTELPALRAAANAQIAAILKDFRGSAAAVAPSDRGRELAESWKQAARAKPGQASLPKVHRVMTAFDDTLAAMQDNSNLTYDSSTSSQNLSDATLIELTGAISVISRVQALSGIAIVNRGMPLSERFRLSGDISVILSVTDLSSDNLKTVSRRLATLMPERAAQVLAMPTISAAVSKKAKKFVTLLSNRVLLQPVPSVSRATVDAEADALIADVHKAFDAFSSILDASLEHRGAVDKAHNRYLLAMAAIGVVFLIGIMMIVAQLIARRDQAALRRAREESARLSVEISRRHAEEALRLSEAQFRTVFDGATIGIAIVDRNGTIVDANNVFRTMFDESTDSAMEGHEAEFSEIFSGERETFEFEQHVHSTIGREIWTDVTVSIVNGPDGGPLFAICMFRDKTELKHSQRRMLHDKTHDALTGLPNRQLFEEHLRRRFAEAGALLDSFFAVLFVDLDHFKDINESMGHAAGDLALTQIAQRMRGSVDARDVVGRLGSDEFAILVQSLGDILHVESVARRVLNNLSKPISISGKSIYLGASIGIAIASSSYERAEDVMRDAEIALQHAKNTGGTRYALFDSKMHSRAQKRLQLTTDLRQAIERSEFRLLYQPVVAINDGRLVGCEALIRWDHPTEGELNPSEFIALAEQTGLAAPIGRFVVRTAAAQLAAWRRNRGGHMDFMMHVNVSASDVTDPEFERHLAQVIEQNGLAPSDFTVEITENVVLDPGTRANIVLERVRERGFKICIDDFGTGYSSLRYLQQFNVDAIKIDRSFVSGADGELASEPIVRTLMTLAEAFDVNVVAEGVESVRQRDMLRNAGCRFAQGFMYARPLSAADMVALYPDVLARLPRTASA